MAFNILNYGVAEISRIPIKVSHAQVRKGRLKPTISVQRLGDLSVPYQLLDRREMSMPMTRLVHFDLL